MPAIRMCPSCGSDMRSMDLISHYQLKSYRVCPDCNAKFTVDRRTKRRQLLVIPLVFATFLLTVAVPLKGLIWLGPAILSHVALWTYLAHVVSKTKYVSYPL